MDFSVIAEFFRNLIFFALHIGSSGYFPKPLTKKEEAQAVEKAGNGDAQARNLLVEHNMRLVVHIIKKYYSAYSDQDDLISIGTIGLIKGINSFNSEKGTKLATYAARCIENEILMHFRGIKKTAQDISMNEPIDTDGEGNPLTLADIICIDDTIADDIDHKFKCRKLRMLVDEISNPREKTIIIMRYGFDGNEPKTQQEVADILGISRSYVSRIETRILNELRRRLEKESCL
ncbi:MAG: RNA polymerase sporulation sigma factor SigK [Clostridia bacterium]|nr:RNA polymerase sporulation sigma factor SigK [Clostridia bacterium]